MIVCGHCLCGACRFELPGPHNWVGHWHCESCRRATASAFTTWIGQPNGAWAFTGDAPQTYQSSPGKVRGFCSTCGTQMFYKSDAYPDETHFYAALLENGTDVAPTDEYFGTERVPWVQLNGTFTHKDLNS